MTVTIDDDERKSLFSFMYNSWLINFTEGVVVFSTPNSTVIEGNYVYICINVTAGNPPASVLGTNVIIRVQTFPGTASNY